jgi:hypothetical protein
LVYVISYKSKVHKTPVGKNPAGEKDFLENNVVYGKFTCGLIIESNFIVRVHARGDDILNESIKRRK